MEVGQCSTNEASKKPLPKRYPLAKGKKALKATFYRISNDDKMLDQMIIVMMHKRQGTNILKSP